MIYLAFGFDNPNEVTVKTFCSTAVQLGYKKVRRWPTWGGRVILCIAVPPWNEYGGLDLYDSLARLVREGSIPLWVSLLYPSQAEWEAGETLSLEAK